MATSEIKSGALEIKSGALTEFKITKNDANVSDLTARNAYKTADGLVILNVSFALAKSSFGNWYALGTVPEGFRPVSPVNFNGTTAVSSAHYTVKQSIRIHIGTDGTIYGLTSGTVSADEIYLNCVYVAKN